MKLIIINPIYRGAVKFEGQEFAGQHEALVSADIWEPGVDSNHDRKFPEMAWSFTARWGMGIERG